MRLLAGALVALCFGMVTPVAAQQTDMDTCPSADACQRAAQTRVSKARSVLNRQRFREAAQEVYPVLRSDNPEIGIPTRILAYSSLTDILDAADLPGFAASFQGSANRLTSAPSSLALLREAELLAEAGRGDEAEAVRSNAETLAIQAANLLTVDRLIDTYQTRGETQRADDLRAQRRDIARRFDGICSSARCRSADVVEAQLLEQSPPDYPRSALRSGQEGQCQIRMNIAETGRATDIETLCSDPVFVEPAYQSAVSTRFTPRFESGAPKPTYGVMFPVEFAVR